MNLLSDVSQVLQALISCEDIQITDYFQASYEKSELLTTLWRWRVQTMSRVMLGIALRKGKSAKEAKEVARVHKNAYIT